MRERVLPPEWAQQSAVLLAWPVPNGDFRPWYPEVEKTYVHIAREISRRQLLIVACADASRRRTILARLYDEGTTVEHVRFAAVDYDDIWVRDTAPLTVVTDDGPRMLAFRFNGWGGKYDCSRDSALGTKLISAGLFGATPFESYDFVLEGGSIETDGEGTLLTTRQCLLNANRNPSLFPEAIEEVLRATLGIRRILWLTRGAIEGDDTDAHIDTLARFCDAETIAYTSCDDCHDPHYADLKAMEAELRRFRTNSGGPYRLVSLPIPQAIRDRDGRRLPATYANFLIINDAVLLPVYREAADDVARERLRSCFPDREIVPVDCRSLIHQYGSLHCMTMQFPRAVPVLPS